MKMGYYFQYDVRFLFLMMALVITNVAADAGWIDAHATFYGDGQGGGTEQGACGYDVFKEGYGLQTTALSTTLFENGARCGSCYEIKCVNSKWCKPGAGSIKITATNLCPPSSGPQAWCNPPNHHFDLSEPMFLNIAIYQGGIVPVQYRRIPCARQGGVKFLMGGNPNYLMVLVFNVGGAGDITGMQIQGSSDRNWVPMTRNWGMNWASAKQWTGQTLSIRLMTSDGRTLQDLNVIPSNWQFGQTYESRSNF